MDRLLRLAGMLSPVLDHDVSPPEVEERAAVAIALRPGNGEPEVLLMTRAKRAGDRWSGQVSLPGGREEAGDGELSSTAVRETREEVGLDLAQRGTPLGRLPVVQARARGRLLPMTITPFVYAVDGDPPLTVGEEATEAFWFPLGRAHDGALDSRFALGEGSTARTLPCWRFEGRVIWGLTFEILRGFLEVLYPEE